VYCVSSDHLLFLGQ